MLDALRFRHPDDRIFYWQDKERREVDFVVRRERDHVDLIECKIDPDELNTAAVQAFRASYPNGANYLAAPAVKEPYRVRRGGRVHGLHDARPVVTDTSNIARLRDPAAESYRVRVPDIDADGAGS